LNGQQANATLKEIEGAARALNAELKGLKTNTQEFADKSKNLQQLNTRLAEIRSQTNAIGDENATVVFGDQIHIHRPENRVDQ
jgi:uncharacterized protein YoxC